MGRKSAWSLAGCSVPGDCLTSPSIQHPFPHARLFVFHNKELEWEGLGARAQNHGDNHVKFNSDLVF